MPADPSMDEVMSALRNADKAGDSAAAQRLATIAKGMQGQGAAKQQHDFTTPGERMLKRAGEFVTEKTGSKVAGFVAETALDPTTYMGVGLGGAAAKAVARPAAERLMQSALKPTLETLRTGKAAQAIETMLDEGISVSKGGMAKLRGQIDALNAEIKSKIASSTATVKKSEVVKYLNGLVDDLKKQVNPQSDLAAVKKAWQDFKSHPALKGTNDIPVQTAQELKSGTYRQLSEKAYGEEKAASIESQKTLSRGLKEEIAKAVPDVVPLNAQESKLLNALNVTERRMLVEMNKNPTGLASLAKNPTAALAFMADRSAAFKSLAARIINRAGTTAGGVAGGAASVTANQLGQSPLAPPN